MKFFIVEEMLSLVRTSDTERKPLRSSCSIGERCSSVREGHPANGTRGCSIITKIGQYMRRLKRRLVVGCMWLWEEKKKDRERERERVRSDYRSIQGCFYLPDRKRAMVLRARSVENKKRKEYKIGPQLRGNLEEASSLSLVRWWVVCRRFEKPLCVSVCNPPRREFFFVDLSLEFGKKLVGE